MTKLLVVSDSGVPTGYGRICDSVLTRLHRRGYEVMAASLTYDGLLPPMYDGERLPYWVASLAGHPNWVEQVLALVNAYQPDVVMVVQDAPYAEAVYNAPLDWSRYGFVVITPVDGAPVYPQWVQMLKSADGTLSISQFGVDTHRAAGIASELCRPGIEPDTFFRLPDPQRAAIRQQLGIAPDAFVVGSVAMNQGRKRWPAMLGAFFEFAKDKPDARFIANTDPVSPAGWDLNQVCQQHGWDTSKIIWRAMCEQRGVRDLRDRYNVMDVHMVIAEREGFGIPLVEAQACGVVSMALDWCSGTEVCADGYGLLVRSVEQKYPYDAISTWGGALNKIPDIGHMIELLQRMYDHPAERAAIAEKGMIRARTWTWDSSVDNVVKVIERVIDKRRRMPQAQQGLAAPVPVPVARPVVPHADGLNQTETVDLVEQGT